MKITSETQMCGIIGYPLRKTLSPTIQNAAFKAANLNWCYVPMLVHPHNVEAAIVGLQSLGFRGVNVTMPHKETVVDYIDEIEPFARMAGAINTIYFDGPKKVGYNTDGKGFLTALERDGDFKPEGKSAVIIGAGGAARSISMILAQNNISELSIVNRNLEKAEDLAGEINKNFSELRPRFLSFNEDLPKIIDSTDLIVNSTSVGWEGGLVVDPDLFHKGHLVADLVYMPEETELLVEAKKREAKTLPGKLMLLYQGAASMEIWTNVEAPIEEMRKALDEVLSINEKGKTKYRSDPHGSGPGK